MEVTTDSKDVLYHSVVINENDTLGTTVASPRPSLPIVAVPTIMFMSGVFGNIVALVVLYRSKREHKHTVFYRLVGGLACTDLFGTLALSPVTITVYGTGLSWIGGQPLCDYFSFMMIFAGLATVLIVGVMAIERYIAILHPYLYEEKFSPGKVLYILAGVWAVAIVIGCFPLMGLGSNKIQYPGTWCFFDSRSDRTADQLFTYIYASVGIIVIVMTGVCNAAVMCVLARMRAKQSKMTMSSQRGQLDNEAQMILLLAGIILVFATCYAPLMVRVIVNQTQMYPVNHEADLLTIRLACLNQILDPWVYILFRKQFFTRIWRLVCCDFISNRKQTTQSAILEKPESNVKTQLPTGNDVMGKCDTNTKSASVKLLTDCCSSKASGPERSGSGKSLLIPMTLYGAYNTGDSTAEALVKAENIAILQDKC